MVWNHFIFFTLLWISHGKSEKIKITVEEGILVGEKIIGSYKDTIYFAFKGIPYARPPVKDLRFKAPLPPLPYEEEKDARQFGPMCVQRESGSKRIVGSEDCLYLNIYTPSLNPVKPLPVIFFIPGTLYKIGSGNDDFYGPVYLMNHEVILVTINYRLGPLGFLALGTKDIPGNAGMKDQVMAMQWVQKNINAFGGDPKQVTIFGQGGGGASVTLHLVSSLSKGLFNRAIVSSGAFFCDWSSPFQPIRRAFGLGRNLGFITDDPEKLKDFLLRQPAERLIETDPYILLSDNVTNILKQNEFTPVKEPYFGEGQFLIQNPVDLIRDGKVNKADLLIGHTQLEALHYTYVNLPLILEYYPFMYELLVPARISAIRSPAENLNISDTIKKYYFGEDIIGLDTIKQFIDFYSFLTQLYAIHEFVDQYPQDGTKKLYHYHFNILADRNYYYKKAKSLGIRKASAGDDLPYIFDGNLFEPKLGKGNDAEEHVDLTVTLFTNFVKFGTPTPEPVTGVVWPEYGAKKEYVFIKNDGLSVTQLTSFYNGPLKFWRDLHADAGVSFRDPWEHS